MNDDDRRAHYRTMLVMSAGACSVAVSEPLEVIEKLICEQADGWFTATADPEGGAVLINARHVMWVGRERTPVEELT